MAFHIKILNKEEPPFKFKIQVFRNSKEKHIEGEEPSNEPLF